MTFWNASNSRRMPVKIATFFLDKQNFVSFTVGPRSFVTVIGGTEDSNIHLPLLDNIMNNVQIIPSSPSLFLYSFIDFIRQRIVFSLASISTSKFLPAADRSRIEDRSFQLP